MPPPPRMWYIPLNCTFHSKEYTITSPPWMRYIPLYGVPQLVLHITWEGGVGRDITGLLNLKSTTLAVISLPVPSVVAPT